LRGKYKIDAAGIVEAARMMISDQPQMRSA
jgi:hypothetical protein